LIEADSSNEKYVKLASDLDEAITLTQKLINASETASSSQADEGVGLMLRKTTTSTTTVAQPKTTQTWGVGDRCEAPWADKVYPGIP